ncbi:unnamed protein product [Closterium sp. NIES-64]|nr:unnamed protein product [Closterium sp. NIES-64]
MRGRGNRGGAWALWLLAESGLFLFLAQHAENAAAHLPLSAAPRAGTGGVGERDPRTWAEGEGETVGRVGEMEAELEGGVSGVAERGRPGGAIGGKRGGGMLRGGVRGGEGEGTDARIEIRQEWGQAISYEHKQQQLKTLKSRRTFSRLKHHSNTRTHYSSHHPSRVYAISFEQKKQQLKNLKAQGRCNDHPKLFRTWLWESAFQEGSIPWVPQPGKYILMDCQRSQVGLDAVEWGWTGWVGLSEAAWGWMGLVEVSNRIGCIRRHLLLAGMLNRTLVVPLKPDEVARFYDRRTFLHLPHLHRCYGPRSAIPLHQLREEVRGAAVNGGSRSAEAGQGKRDAGGGGREEAESAGGSAAVSEAPQETEEERNEEEGAVMVQQVLCPYEACYMQPWTNKPSLLPELEGVIYHNMTWTALNMPLSHLFTLSDLRSLGSSLLPSADVVLFGDSYQWNLQGNISKSVGLPFGSSGSGGGSKSEGITAASDSAPVSFTTAVAAAGPSKGSAAEAGATQQQGSVSSEMGTGRDQRQPQRYLAVHWRRGDLLLLYKKILAFLTVENTGRCITERMVRSGNISTVFLATDADGEEVGQLERVILGYLPGVEIVQLPEDLTGRPWARELEGGGSWTAKDMVQGAGMHAREEEREEQEVARRR